MTAVPADRRRIRTVPAGPLRAAGRLTVYLLATVALMPVQWLALGLAPRFRVVFPRLYHRFCARLLGLDIRVRGRMVTGRPVLFVCNHLGYLDITVLGSVIEGSFVAKREVAGWPLFGWLARLQRTVFVERRSHGPTARRQGDALAARLSAGDSLILFAEGTSGDGRRVLAFKPALFAAAAAAVPAGLGHDGSDRVTVQPVTVAATRLDGAAIGRFLRQRYAWFGDMALGPHLWTFLGLGRVTVDVTFHPPAGLDPVGGRKALAAYCHRHVAQGLAVSNTGRDQA